MNFTNKNTNQNSSFLLLQSIKKWFKNFTKKMDGIELLWTTDITNHNLKFENDKKSNYQAVSFLLLILVG